MIPAEFFDLPDVKASILGADLSGGILRALS